MCLATIWTSGVAGLAAGSCVPGWGDLVGVGVDLAVGALADVGYHFATERGLSRIQLRRGRRTEMGESIRRAIRELAGMDERAASALLEAARRRSPGLAVRALAISLAVAALVVSTLVRLLSIFAPAPPLSILLHGLAAGTGAVLALTTHRFLLWRLLIREVRRELAARR
ncbi:MAG: hypothetical protein V2J02_10600 [Pseudomonadales bacterium]|jgi:hypothetical protein|nr:hypothetical protein [Pseudomonadales bacterium]